LQITVTTDSAGEVGSNPSGDANSMSDDPASTTDSAGGASEVDSGPSADVGHTSDAADCSTSTADVNLSNKTTSGTSGAVDHLTSTTDSAGSASKVDSGSCDVAHTSDAADLREVLEQISPMPKSKTVRQRKRTAEHAEVLTGSPFKMKLLEKQTLKENKVAAQSRTTTNKKTSQTAANKKTSKTAAKPGNKKIKCRMDKGRKPSQFPHAVAATKKAVGQPCSVCGILENSKEDIAFAQDWIQCNMCMGWCHEMCGEIGGILDDDYFTCAKCV